MSIWIYRLVRWLFAVLFLYAGVSKLVDRQSFAIVIDAFGLVPESWVMTIAVILPTVEVIAAIGLILDVRGSLTIIAGLTAIFMIILSYGIWMGLDIDCGCFGPGDPEAEAFSGLRKALFRDMVMLLGITYLYFWRFKRSVLPVPFGPILTNHMVLRKESK